MLSSLISKIVLIEIGVITQAPSWAPLILAFLQLLQLRACAIRRPLVAAQLSLMVKLFSLKNCSSRKETIMYRRKLSRRGSKRLFTATALKTNRRNIPHMARGGIRF